MADTDTGVEIPDEWDTLEEWASDAVMGANNWLITIRNAEDEGYDPWSDRFTSGEVQSANDDTAHPTGLMSYAEGLTAIAMTDEYAGGDTDWLRLQQDIYREDLRQLLADIHPDEAEPNYTPEPYLPGELTSDFTDAVSFSTSALMGAVQSDIELTRNEVSMNDIQEALETNIEWFLDNEVKTGDDALAWAWVGTDDPDYEEPMPENYFTYSAIYPLCELLDESDNDVIQAAVDGYEDRITRHLEGAKTFLLEEYWQGDCWGGPDRNSSEVLATCYTIIALSLIDNLVDGVELDEADHKRISTGMEYFLNEVERDLDNIWQEKEEYNCGGSSYMDGSGPYLFLDTIAEFLNYDIGDIDDMEFNRTEIRDLRDELARQVLDQCWAGEPGFKQKGFRHLGNPRQPKDDPKNNPTVIYTTQVGIETFLLNILDNGAELTQSAGPEPTTTQAGTDRTSQPPATTTADQPVHNQYNMSFVFAGDEATTRTEGSEQLRSQISAELERLFGSEEPTDGLSNDDIETIKSFTRTVTTAQTDMHDQFDDVYEDFRNRLGRDVKQQASTFADQELAAELKEINVDAFLRMLTECYFAQDEASYVDELEYYREEYWNLVFAPQREAWKALHPEEELDPDVVTDFDERTSTVQEVLEGFAADVLNGTDPQAVGNEFDQRDFGR